LAILDEPTANLDPLGRIEFLEKIKELHQREGTDFFVSSHILPELERICDWVSIVNHGIVVAQGRTEDLTSEYSASIFKIEASDNDLLASQLKETGLVEKAWTEAGTLYCKVRNAKDLQSGLPKLLTELRLELRSFQPMTSNLEEIFKSVIGRDKE
jgi:ABC-2 type transport system ATP-binding protein